MEATLDTAPHAAESQMTPRRPRAATRVLVLFGNIPLLGQAAEDSMAHLGITGKALADRRDEVYEHV